MSRIFWDTNLFIYLMEGSGDRAARVRALRSKMIARGDTLLTSAMTLGEVLVKPRTAGDLKLADAYEALILGAASLVVFDADVAKAYADVRRQPSIKAPDAIQLACASHAGTDLFVTNDDRLSRVVASGIHFITSLDRAFL